MVRKKKKPVRRKKKKTPKRFRFQLGLAGVAGIGVVVFCLFLWMFLLGIWAGQTILLPSASCEIKKASRSIPAEQSPVKILKPRAKKNPVSRQNGLFRQSPDGSDTFIILIS